MLKKTVFSVIIVITIAIFLEYLTVFNCFKNIHTFLHSNDHKQTPHENNLEKSRNSNLFTTEELKQYDGNIKTDLYLAILGCVYNVTKGWKHYGPGESYNVFIGRDASLAFITGDFDSDKASNDVLNLSFSEILSLNDWKAFYEKEYELKGYLIGKFYDSSGKKTEYSKLVDEKIIMAIKDKSENEEQKKKFPPCNVEWSPEKGSKVWCTKKSGGIERNWVGVPRKLYKPGSNSFQCACVREEDAQQGNMKEYLDCPNDSTHCYIHD